LTYRLQIVPSAIRELAELPLRDRQRLDGRIRALADDPRPPQSKALQGQKNLFRLRVGRYRVIYEIRDEVLLIVILKVGHRRDVYRRF